MYRRNHGRPLDLAARSPGITIGHRARMVEAAVALHQAHDEIVLAALGARAADHELETPTLVDRGRAHGVQQHQRTLALEQVALRRLAGLPLVADDVEEIVADLEGNAQKCSESRERGKQR